MKRNIQAFRFRNSAIRLLFAIVFSVGFLPAFSAMAQEVRYYPVPKGSHPHDVAPAPDGTVWYTAWPSADWTP